MMMEWFSKLFTKTPDPMLGMVATLIEQQQQTQLAIISMAQEMAAATSKQAEVLNSYLKLFQTPGEPQRWEADPEADNRKELEAAGFPFAGTEKEQAEWVMNNMDRL